MSTVVTNLEVALSETRSRRLLRSFRNTFAEVTTYNQSTVELDRGEDQSFVCARFAFFHLRSPATVTLTKGSESMAMENVSGSFAFPVACTVNISVPADDANTITRLVDIVYG